MSDPAETTQNHIERCKKIFVEWAAYWRSIVTGMLVIAGLATGVVAWAMSVEARAASTSTKLEQLEMQTNAISSISSDINLLIDNQRAIMQALSVKPR